LNFNSLGFFGSGASQGLVAKPEDGRSRGNCSSRHRRHHHHINGLSANLKSSRRQKKVYNVIIISTA
jgi:hypothetical protein